MSEIKVSLTITLPGSVMLSKEECLKTIQKEVIVKNKFGKSFKKTIDMQVEDWSKMDKHSLSLRVGKDLETYTYFTRKSKPASQSININKEAFEEMSFGECPAWCKPNDWKAMSPKKRLEEHLKRMMEHLGGTSFTYHIFED